MSSKPSSDVTNAYHSLWPMAQANLVSPGWGPASGDQTTQQRPPVSFGSHSKRGGKPAVASWEANVGRGRGPRATPCPILASFDSLECFASATCSIPTFSALVIPPSSIARTNAEDSGVALGRGLEAVGPKVAHVPKPELMLLAFKAPRIFVALTSPLPAPDFALASHTKILPLAPASLLMGACMEAATNHIFSLILSFGCNLNNKAAMSYDHALFAIQTNVPSLA